MSETKATARTEGWVSIIGASKWHYVKTDGRSLCGRWLYLGKAPPEQGKDDHEDNCNHCRKKLEYRKSKA